MIRKFDDVLWHPLNNSRAKESHKFSKAQKLPYQKDSNCRRDFYDLSKTMLASSISFTRKFPTSPRLKQNKSFSPSPGAYKNYSFVDEANSYRKGPSFGRQQKMVRKTTNTPGPGKYTTKFDPHQSLSYTMRPKTQRVDHSNLIGPGHYNIPDTITKDGRIYTNNLKSSGAPKMGTQKRFYQKHISKSQYVPAPGAYRQTRSFVYDPRSTNKNLGGYSFGRDDKLKLKKIDYPGPGSYYHFSQFYSGRLRTDY